jgi:hypothetical protein
VITLYRPRTTKLTLAREVIGVRRRTLAIISSGEAPKGGFPGDSGEAWRVFLAAECCALPLARELRRLGLEDRLDTLPREELRRAELRESQRVLAARSTLDALDLIGERLGIPIVVLKGGESVAIREGSTFDLGDVDILVGADAARPLWDALCAEGWRPSREAILPGMETDQNHYDSLIPPGGGLPLELHRGVRYGQPGASALSGEPIDRRASLHRLNRLDAIRLMLWHSVVQHPHRRGHLRDVFLLGFVLQQLAPQERDALGVSVAADPFALELREMLAAASSLGTSSGVATSPNTEHFVAWKYATLLRVDWVADELLPGWTALGYIPLERRAIRRRRLRSELRRAFGPVPRESRFRPGWSTRMPAAAQTAIGWLARLTSRLTMLGLLGLVGSRVRRTSARIAEPSAGSFPPLD